MVPSLKSRLRAWRDRWRKPSRALPRAPYRAAAPRPAPPRARPMRRAMEAVRALWPKERLRGLALTVAVVAGAVGLAEVLAACARFAAPRVSEPVTHVLALPFGVLFGLVVAAGILAAGWFALCGGALVLASLWHLVVGVVRSVRGVARALFGESFEA